MSRSKSGLFKYSMCAAVAVNCAMAGAALAAPAAAGSLARVTLPRVTAAPRLASFIDPPETGPVDGLVRIEGLVTRLPRYGDPVSERTVAYLGYDDKYLYAAFVCYDSQPGAIRAHLNVRDQIRPGDDSVALQIDTFRDLKHAYGFQVNPLGVQQDGMWIEGRGWDVSFDTVWHAETHLAGDRYVVLMRVPFKSLRFSRADRQNWGVFLFRGIARRNEESFWPEYSTKIAGRMNQAALLDGLERVSPGRNVQVMPFIGGRAFRTLDAGPQGARWVSDAADTDTGADARVIVKDSLAVDATFNPDFSQVESDAPQVTVNKRFEIFFPERRPFFLENANYFGTPLQLVFTRRILDPDLGARLTGRLGRYALGGYWVRDRPSPSAEAMVGILRVNRDLGNESTLGAFLSQRGRGDGLNRVGAVDGRFKLSRNWVAAFQAATSLTRDPGAPERSGNAYHAWLQRSGQRFGYSATFNDLGADFHTDLGFIERTDIRSLEQTAAYRTYPGRKLLSWGPDLVVEQVWDRRNRRLDRLVTPWLYFEWPGQTTLGLYVQSGRVRLRPRELAFLAEEADTLQDRRGFEFSTSFARGLTLSLRAATGRTANLAPPPGARPELAGLTELNVSADVRPTRRLSLAANYFLTRLTARPSGGAIFTDQIADARLNFQFTRVVSARTIVQYNDLAATPGATALVTSRRLNFDILLTWLRSPGTALYVGYNDNFENLDPSLTLTPHGWLRRPHGLIRSGRQFFVKFSYLLRP